MKKGLLILLCATALFVGCDKDNVNTNTEATNSPGIETTAPTESNNPAENKEIQGTVAEYFPLDEDTLYKYSGSNQFSNQEVYVIYSDGNKAQRRTQVLDFVSTEVIEVTEDKVRLLYGDTESNGFENFLDRKHTKAITVLKDPIRINNTWESEFISNSSTGEFKGESKITAVEVPVKTPAGEFECIEVTTEYDTGHSNIEYYAKGVGLVKREYVTITRVEGTDKVTEAKEEIVLSEIISDTDYEIKLNTIFPNEMADDVLSEERTISIRTNEDIKLALEELLKNPSEKIKSPIITENTKINSISVDREAKEVHVDLSKEYVEEMNAGSGYEALLLESLASTFADFYRVSSFYLSIEGESYTTGH